jgi:hypothetical protein
MKNIFLIVIIIFTIINTACNIYDLDNSCNNDCNKDNKICLVACGSTGNFIACAYLCDDLHATCLSKCIPGR